MIVNIDQVRVGVKKFVENELAYKATGLTKFMIYFALPTIDNAVVSYVSQARENFLFKEMFDEEGHIHLDKVYDRAIFAMDKSGKLLLERVGISLDRSDVEKIYSYIREA